MDFDRTEILNPNSVVISPVDAFDLNDPTWDVDNDLIVSKNGVYIDFPKPLENFEWLEIEIHNTDASIPNLQINCYSENTIGGFVNRSIESGLLDYFGTLIFRVPNIGRVERIKIFGIPNTAPYAGKFIAVKSIKVVKKSDFFTKAVAAAIVPVMGAGWAYDGAKTRWVRNFAIGIESVSIQAACTFGSSADYCCVRIYTLAQDGLELFPVVFDQYTMTMFGQDISLDYSGNSDKQAFPINIGILGPAGGGNVYVEFKYGSFLAPVNVFGGNPQPSVPLNQYNPGSGSVVDNDNLWNGSNTFNGPVIMNGGLKIDNLGGYLKAAAGIISVVASIPVADVAGLGTSATHPVGDFFQVANNLNEGVPATMRTSLGLGTIATQNANGVAITGGTIAGVTINTSTIGAITPSTIVGTSINATGAIIGGVTAGHYANIASAASTYQLYLNGTARSYINGGLMINVVSGAVGVSLNVAQPTDGTTSLFGIRYVATSPAAATVLHYGVSSSISTAAAAFVLAELNNFAADSNTKGAGSTITNLRGFYAANALAVGTNNYGFYSDINTAATTWQAYMGGSAPSYYASYLSIGNNAPAGTSFPGMLLVDGTHLSTATTIAGINSKVTLPSTATGLCAAFRAELSTVASAFTNSDAAMFLAHTLSKGATSGITNAYGFFASLGMAGVATNTYGFFSNIANAATSFAFYGSGTANSQFNGSITVNNAGTGQTYYVSLSGTHTNTSTNLLGLILDITTPATAIGNCLNYQSVFRTTAAAYTTTLAVHYAASTTVKGAGSSITSLYGFYAGNSIAVAVGTLCAGFYSDIGTATNTYQLYMAGSAESRFLGVLAMINKSFVEAEATVTYSASMTIDASAGNEQIITVTNGTAFTLNAPTNPRTGQYLEITIRNTSGGAAGVATWNAVFKMVAWVQPATAFSRTIVFRYNGTNWVEKGRTAADVPN